MDIPDSLQIFFYSVILILDVPVERMKMTMLKIFRSHFFKALISIMIIVEEMLVPSMGVSLESGVISASEVDSVFNALKDNDWKLVETFTDELMQRDLPAQRYLIARLRYIYLYAIAGQIEKKMISYEEIVDKIKKVRKKMIIQPWHPVNYDGGGSCFNQICKASEKPDYLFTAQTNNDATTIYSFEYYNTGKPIDVTSYNGQHARLGGILERIEINKNLKAALKNNSGVTWYFRFQIKEGFIQFDR